MGAFFKESVVQLLYLLKCLKIQGTMKCLVALTTKAFKNYWAQWTTYFRHYRERKFNNLEWFWGI